MKTRKTKKKKKTRKTRKRGKRREADEEERGGERNGEQTQKKDPKKSKIKPLNKITPKIFVILNIKSKSCFVYSFASSVKIQYYLKNIYTFIYSS